LAVVDATQRAQDPTNDFEKRLRLLAPPIGSSTSTTPKFIWEAFPGGVDNYQLIILKQGVDGGRKEWEDVKRIGSSFHSPEVVPEHREYELLDPLPAGEYLWYVKAFSDSCTVDASHEGQPFTILPSDDLSG